MIIDVIALCISIVNFGALVCMLRAMERLVKILDESFDDDEEDTIKK
jgi:hypothetical protein